MTNHAATSEAPFHTFERYLTLGEVCEITGVPKATFYTWRTTRPGYGPRATKIGRELRFKQSEVRRWLDTLPTEEFPEDLAAV